MPIRWRQGERIILPLSLYDGHVIHLWWKSTEGVVADEPYSDLQVSGKNRERGSNSEIVARRTETWYEGASRADKLAKGSEVPKGNRNLESVNQASKRW